MPLNRPSTLLDPSSQTPFGVGVWLHVPEGHHAQVLEAVAQAFANELAWGGDGEPAAEVGPFAAGDASMTDVTDPHLGVTLRFFGAVGTARSDVSFQTARAVRHLVKRWKEGNLLPPGTAAVCAIWPDPNTWYDLVFGTPAAGKVRLEPNTTMAVGLTSGPEEVFLACSALLKEACKVQGARPIVALSAEQEHASIAIAMTTLLNKGVGPDIPGSTTPMLEEWRAIQAAESLERALSAPSHRHRSRM